MGRVSNFEDRSLLVRINKVQERQFTLAREIQRIKTLIEQIQEQVEADTEKVGNPLHLV